MRAMGRRVSVAAAAVLLPVFGLVPPHAGAASIPRVQRLAQVMTPHGVRARPDGHARVIELVQPLAADHETNARSCQCSHTARGKQGVMWLKVLLPGRPNSHTGWIKRIGTVGATHQVGDRHPPLAAPRRCLPRRTAGRGFRAVVGKPSTPTPRGRFFVEEWFSLTPGAPGGPFALALSARSNVYQEFEGGPGQIALHGIYRIGGTPGTAESHGCVRLDSASMTWLGTHIHGGVPVTIVYARITLKRNAHGDHRNPEDLRDS